MALDVSKASDAELEQALHCLEYAYGGDNPYPEDIALFAAALEEIKKRTRTEVLEYVLDPYEATSAYQSLNASGLPCYPPWETTPS